MRADKRLSGPKLNDLLSFTYRLGPLGKMIFIHELIMNWKPQLIINDSEIYKQYPW